MSDKFPDNLRYTEDHEWALVEGNIATIGITFHAQDALGEVVFVDLPEEGRELKSGDTFGAVESIKAVSDLYAPLSGRVIEVNQALSGQPDLLNSAPYDDAWMIKLELADDSEVNDLMDANAYQDLVDSL